MLASGVEIIVEAMTVFPENSKTAAHRQAVIETARIFTENSVPVIELRPGLKQPVHRGDTWGHFDDPDVVAEAFVSRTAVPNIGILLHPKSPIIAVDVDGRGPHVDAKIRELGVSRDDPTWAQVTGRRNGRFHVFYFWTGERLPRIASKPDGLPIDLLSNGFAVVAPSNTNREPDGGGPYEWVKGHSPFDISQVELSKPPGRLIDWWLDRAAKAPLGPQPGPSGKVGAWALVNEPIAEGARNETLTRVAGWLRHAHRSDQELEALLLAINDGRCKPPLPTDEVTSIARSVLMYGDGTKRGPVIPNFIEES